MKLEWIRCPLCGSKTRIGFRVDETAGVSTKEIARMENVDQFRNLWMKQRNHVMN